MKSSNLVKSSINQQEVTMNTFQKAGEFAWRHKGKIIVGTVTLATGGLAAPALAAAMGAAGLLGVAGTVVLINIIRRIQ